MRHGPNVPPSSSPHRLLIAAVSLLTVLSSAACGDPEPAEDLEMIANEQPLGLTVTAVADTYVRNGSSSNYGGSSTLKTDRSSSDIYEQAYLRFALDGANGIARALLRIYVVNGSKSSADVYAVSDTSWSEIATTWTNRPTVDGARLVSIARTSKGNWYNFDVTAGIPSGAAQVSFVLIPRSTDGFDVSSRESSNPPQLVLTVSESGSGTTDAGTSDAGIGTKTDAGTATDAGTKTDAGTTTDAGTKTDAGTTTDGGTVARRTPCVDPLTGVQRTSSETEKLNADVFGILVRSSPDKLCIYGNGHKVDQGHIEPADAYTWSRTYSGQFWEDNYHSMDNALDMRVAYPIIENIAMYNSGQGVMLRGETQYFAVRDVYIQHAGDDGIESDFIVGGVIDDVLIDKAFAPIAWRMSSAPCEPKPNNVVKITNSILRAFPQYGIYPNWADAGKYIPGYSTVFKWEKSCQYATKLELTNTIIVANQDAMASDNLNLTANGNLIKSENNTLVWLGSSPYSGTIPSGFKVTNDINVFVQAWQDWFRRHPDIPKPSAGPDINYNLPPLK